MPTPHARSANACEACRRRKVKCSGEQPCRACVKHDWDCVFGLAGRRRYSEAQVKKLLDRIESYEDRLGERPGKRSMPEQSNPDPPSQSHPPPLSAAPLSSPDSVAPGFRPVHLPQHQDPGPQGVGLGNNIPLNLEYSDSISSASPATDLASGPAFVSQVRSLLDRSTQHIAPPPEMANQTQAGLSWRSTQPSRNTSNDLTLSLEESQHLLDQFLFYLGVSQHFFDSRSFSDSLIFLFQSPQTREQQKQTTWYTEYLLVMAMAKLMDVEQPTSQPPGADLFAEALDRIPAIHQMGDGGVLIVEILTLIATYFQWCDKKYDAYIHIGLALRLAISLGCNLPENEQTCLPSQSTHRLRLWWTVYMLDRRLSSGLGLAAGADERQLRAGFPRHAVGFQSPVALTINIRIARVTDDIMSSLYGTVTVTQVELVRKIQDILQELYGIGRSLPQSLVLDFSRPLQTVTRTGASLYLMLFQAIILCTRPMLLRRVRLEVQRQDESQPPEPDILARFCDTCNEAATKSLAILYALRRQKSIPRYGFFDLDATFSGAFVLVMVGFINKSPVHPPSLDQAFEVLRFLSRSGNSAAEQRFQDINQSCLHVWPDYRFDIHASDHLASENDTDTADPTRYQRAGSAQGGSPLPPPLGQGFQYMAPVPDGHRSIPGENDFPGPWEYSSSTDAAFQMQGDLAIDMASEAEVIYSSFHNPTLPLTGVDYMDWLEIEKVLNATAA